MGYDKLAGKDRTLQDIEKPFSISLSFFLPPRKNSSGGFASAAVLFFRISRQFSMSVENFFQFSY